jgi:hypothetical protein
MILREKEYSIDSSTTDRETAESRPWGGAMHQSRRRLFVIVSYGLAAIFTQSKATPAQNPIPPPNPRRDMGGDPDESPNPPPGAKKALLEQHQKDIKKDIEKLYTLASELKTEVEKTDATAILSLAMVKKAEEIEKLARQIKDHARG